MFVDGSTSRYRTPDGIAVLETFEETIAVKGGEDVGLTVRQTIWGPLIDEAITLDHRHNTRSGKHAVFIPVVHSDKCTGCGKCERACVLEEAAIKVLPARLAKGELGHHYRWGWKEKQRAGESLVPEDPEHRYNLPDGQRYDFEGDGLIIDNPLDTLKRHQESAS